MQHILEELNLLGITMDQFKEFKYAGGSKGAHANYFKTAYPSVENLPHKDKCICGHRIVENCYVFKDGIFIVLGNCCIKKYVTKSGRTCEDCGESHKNRKVNKCNECKKKKYCYDCKVLITRPRHTHCHKCYFKDLMIKGF
jgi:hypothetical protein